MTNDMGAELEELIKKAQMQPNVADFMAFYAQYSKLLQKNAEYRAAMTPQGISSYSSNTS